MPDPKNPPDHRIRGGLYPVFLGIIAFLVSFGIFARNLREEPRFTDESAFISQAYFLDLFVQGNRNHPFWIEYPAYDLPPLPKYLIGLALHAGSHPIPPRMMAIDWYRKGTATVVGDESTLLAARVPSLVCGAMGCVAIFAIGSITRGRGMGLLAAALLALNPLYRLHARRAMADLPAEALTLMTLAVGLFLWKKLAKPMPRRRSWIGLSVVAGLLAGLAVLAKLNGGLALMTLASWTVLGLLLPENTIRANFRRMVSLSVAGFFALVTFVILNPFLYAHPKRPITIPLLGPVAPDQSLVVRLKEVIAHRVQVSQNARTQFPEDALNNPAEQALALGVQGFGRFGPLGPSHSDSKRRFDWKQDRGAILWGPLVLAGLAWTVTAGKDQERRGSPPVAWLLGLQFVVACGTVGSFLPLAWDRYFLPIQASSALLASGVTVATIERVVRRARRA